MIDINIFKRKLKMASNHQAKSHGPKIKNRPGFSLIEILVSVMLFVVIVMSATEIFRLVISSQRDAIASQNVQESLKYFFEVIGKEMRMAARNGNAGPGTCVGPGFNGGQIFSISSNSLGQVLKFRNYYGECVTYELALDGDSQRFQITRDNRTGFISPKKINIESLKFAVDANEQVKITVFLRAWAIGEDRFKSEMDIQTTISSRYYK